MEEALFNSRFPGYVNNFLEHVDRTSSEGLDGEQQAEAVWVEARPSHRQLTTAGMVVDAAEWRRMTKDVTPCSAALVLMTRYLFSAKSFSKEVDALEDGPLIDRYAVLQRTIERKRFELGANQDKFAFFNEPRCALDQAYWSRLKSWSIDEAAAISLGKDPRRVSLTTLSPLNSVRLSPFKQNYAEIIEYFKRELKESDPAKQIDRSNFARFSILNAMANQTQLDERDIISTQSRHSLYKIILMMTIRYYALNLRASTAENIVFNKKLALDDIGKTNIVLDEKTFLKYVGEAIDFSKRKELFRRSFSGKSQN